jgi:hypothetical protein
MGREFWGNRAVNILYANCFLLVLNFKIKFGDALKALSIKGNSVKKEMNSRTPTVHS